MRIVKMKNSKLVWGRFLRNDFVGLNGNHVKLTKQVVNKTRCAVTNSKCVVANLKVTNYVL